MSRLRTQFSAACSVVRRCLTGTLIGEYLKRRRLQLHLFRADMAQQLGVDITSIRNLGQNLYQPAELFTARDVDWLGYDLGPL